MEWLTAAALAVVLLACWAAATRRHRRSRAGRDAEWAGGDSRPDLWTSAARCPSCRAVGGLLEPTGGSGAVFTCMACGARHRREHRG